MHVVLQLGNGVWYEIARYPNEFENTNCGSYEFKPKGNNKILMQPLGSKIPQDSPDYIETIFELDPEAGNKGILLHELTYGSKFISLNLHILTDGVSTTAAALLSCGYEITVSIPGWNKEYISYLQKVSSNGFLLIYFISFPMNFFMLEDRKQQIDLNR